MDDAGPHPGLRRLAAGDEDRGGDDQERGHRGGDRPLAAAPSAPLPQVASGSRLIT